MKKINLNYLTIPLLIIVIGLSFYIITSTNNSHSEKIKSYEKDIEDANKRIKILAEQKDSIDNVYKESKVILDSLYLEVEKDSIVYIQVTERRNERINNISNMSSDDKYLFFTQH